MGPSSEGPEDSLHIGDARSTLELQVLAQIRDSLSVIHRDNREMRDTLTDTRERLIRLEERDDRLKKVEARAEKHEGMLAALLKDKDQRDGAISAWTWLLRNWPVLAGIVILIGTILVANGRLK